MDDPVEVYVPEGSNVFAGVSALDIQRTDGGWIGNV